MEVAPNPLARTYTAPALSHSRLADQPASSVHNPHQSHIGSSYSQFPRSSNSTQDAVSNFPQPPRGPNTPPNAPSGVGATNNVINTVADKETSLFQFCVNLRKRLRVVPNFEDEIFLTEELAEEDEDSEPLDPVTLLWRTFRRGYPLLTIYNASEPDTPLVIEDEKVTEVRRSKAATFKFLQACVHVLGFHTQDCFILSDLYGEDTSGFVKVARVVSRVADKIPSHTLGDPTDAIDQDSPGQTYEKRSHRQHIVDELVRTERTYVHHLEVLHSFKKFVEQRGVIPGDAIHDIFLNLNALLDFQRRFLIRVEQINALPEDQQDWGKEFYRYSSAFRVYESYIANQKNCEETAMREYEKLREVGGPPELQQLVESPTHFTAFLLKPFQRLSKYPLLLKELRDKGDLDEQRRISLSTGIEAITTVLERTNNFIALQERAEAVQSLKDQVEDWKEHKIESFGELLLHGNFTVYKNDSKQSEREYRMYLFEKILLCCKDITDKPKNKIMNKPPSNSTVSKSKPKMAMKGRIFMQNVTETTFLSKPNYYTCQIYWRGEGPNIGNFVVKFPTEETMKQWREAIEHQRKVCTEQAHRQFMRSNSQAAEFGYLQQYRGEEGEEEDNDVLSYEYNEKSHLLDSRHGSSTSLRSRSTTGESFTPPAQTQVRAAGTKHGTPLTLRTQQLQSNGQPGPSFFSPVAESPISSRTSSSSGMTTFPRQSTPHNGWHGADESNRFTAPAHMNRAVQKDSQNSYYQQTDPRTGRPIPAQAVPMHPSAIAHTRLRSASSPDVHAQNATSRQVTQNAPPVPSVPQHMSHQQAVVNRSLNNSPSYGNGTAVRPAAQSSNSGLRREGIGQGDSARQSREYEEVSKHHRQDSSQSRWESGNGLAHASSGFGALGGQQAPASFRVKVEVPSEGSSMMLVVPYNISYNSLRDRIDAKLQRSTNLSLISGSVRLQYLYDAEMANIQTDEDVQTAFETWRESFEGRQSIDGGSYPEVKTIARGSWNNIGHWVYSSLKPGPVASDEPIGLSWKQSDEKALGRRLVQSGRLE